MLKWSFRRATHSMVLRDYQQECIDTCLAKLKSGVKRQAVSLPVGSGKTVIFSNLVARVPVPDSCPTATRILILAHRTELLDQATNQIKRVMPDLLSHEIIKEQGNKMPSAREIEEARVVIASVPTLGNLAKDRVEDRFDPKLFKCIVIDEAHHAAAGTYARLLTRMDALSDDSHLLVWGCSATLRRHDGRSLEAVFKEVVYHKSFLEMIQQKYLCNMIVTTVQTKTSLAGVGSRMGDFVTSQLASRINNPSRNRALLQAWQEKAQGKRHSTLIFAADVKHIQDLVSLFTEHGHKAYGIHGKTTRSQRSEILRQFADGDFPVLINCGILTEGVDITRIDCIVLAKPTKSGVLLQQMIGRGLRRFTCPNTNVVKQDCLLIDFADTCADNEFGIHATVPTLMGLRPDFKLEEGEDLPQMMEKISEFSKFPKIFGEARSLGEMEHLAKENEEELVQQASRECQLTLSFQEKTLTDIFDAASIQSDDDALLRNVSPLAWVRVGKYECVLSLAGKEAVIVSRDEETSHFVAIYREKRSKEGKRKTSHWSSSQVILHHDSLTSTIKAVDTWVSSKNPFLASRILLRNSFWRKKPASDAQMKLLKGKGLVTGNKLLQSGTAADMITRLVYGAKGKAAEQLKERRREEKEKKKREKTGHIFAAPTV